METNITVEVLTDPEDLCLYRLENEYLLEIGEEPLTREKQQRLVRAIRDNRITFFLAKHNSRPVGMCSVAACFSTFACTETGIFEDFYIMPAFRGTGIARKLAQAAQAWCAEHDLASLTVTCAPCDEPMYQSLGFSIRLGTTFAHLP